VGAATPVGSLHEALSARHDVALYFEGWAHYRELGEGLGIMNDLDYPDPSVRIPAAGRDWPLIHMTPA
jgi:hypothetical protein